MKSKFKFFNNYSFRIFCILFGISLFFISIFTLCSNLLFIKFMGDTLSIYEIFSSHMGQIMLDAFLKSYLYIICLIIIPTIIVSLFFTNYLTFPLNLFCEKIKTMLNDNELFLINEEGFNEFRELAHNWNLLLNNAIEFKNTNEDLKHQSDTDGLTKLYNHNYFVEKLESSISQKSSNITLIFFDIDKFKSINDTYGHLVGDKILATVSSLIKSTLIIEGYAKSCIVGRYGGEEITVMLTNIDKDIAFDLAEKIRLRIFYSSKIKEILPDRVVSISAGIANYPSDSYSTSDLINKADSAMYHSKNNGRNQTTIYSSSVIDKNQ